MQSEYHEHLRYQVNYAGSHKNNGIANFIHNEIVPVVCYFKRADVVKKVAKKVSTFKAKL